MSLKLRRSIQGSRSKTKRSTATRDTMSITSARLKREKKSALPWRNCTDLFARENGWRNGTKSEKMERGQDDIKIGNKQTCKEISTKNYLIIIYFLLFSLHPPSAEHPFHLHVRSFVERFGGIKRWSNVYVHCYRSNIERGLSSSRWNFGVVEIYDVSNVLAVPIDYPIVSIER